MDKEAKIFIAGHGGLAGSALVKQLKKDGFSNFIVCSRNELDLTDQVAVRAFFSDEMPEYVFLAAAKVGGIHANEAYPAEFIRQNLAIQTNMIHESWRAGVKRLLFLGSSCIYPKLAPQPMKEDHLLSGKLESTNEPYAIAKIAGLIMCASYNRQYGTRFIGVMPTNLYGPGDNFHPENSHVLPALIRRFHEAKQAGDGQVVIWGTGTPKREFLYVDDMAAGCVFVMNLPDEVVDGELAAYPKPNFVNLGTGYDVSIEELAFIVKQVVGFEGDLVFDPSKPDGAPRKLLDVSRMRSLGWEAGISLQEGIEKTYQWFLANVGHIREK